MKSAASNRYDVRRDGFTLFEVLIVLSILIVISMMVLPMLQGSTRENRLKTAAEEVHQELAGTRLHAIESGLQYQFLFEPEGRNYLIMPAERDADDLNEEVTRRRIARRLPEGYAFDVPTNSDGSKEELTTGQIHQDLLTDLPDASELSGIEWSPPILFYPDGTSLYYEFTVKETRDDGTLHMGIAVRELTGAVSVSKVQAVGGR